MGSAGRIMTNPVGAYGYTADENYDNVTLTLLAGGTIAVGQVVQIGATGAVTANDTLETDPVLGVAVSAGVSGGPVEVCVYGPCQVQSDGGNDGSTGADLYADINGRVTAGTESDNDYVVGIQLEALGSSAGALVLMFVQPARVR